MKHCHWRTGDYFSLYHAQSLQTIFVHLSDYEYYKTISSKNYELILYLKYIWCVFYRHLPKLLQIQYAVNLRFIKIEPWDKQRAGNRKMCQGHVCSQGQEEFGDLVSTGSDFCPDWPWGSIEILVTFYSNCLCVSFSFDKNNFVIMPLMLMTHVELIQWGRWGKRGANKMLHVIIHQKTMLLSIYFSIFSLFLNATIELQRWDVVA